MACGICAPEVMRRAHDCEGSNVVYGYTTYGPQFEFAVKALYNIGAEHCIFDYPTNGVNVLRRPGMKRLSKIMRTGDVLIAARETDLGILAPDVLDDEGIDVRFLHPELLDPLRTKLRSNGFHPLTSELRVHLHRPAQERDAA